MRAASFVLILSGLSGASATLGFCNDKDNSCGAWARDGECEGDNGEHVKTICPHSCGVCSLMCSDRDESCASWAKQGECTSNAGVSSTAAASSLLLAPCPGVPPTACTQPDMLHAGHMQKECPTSCGLCAPKCADVHVDCNHWAKDGQCADNPHFMNMHCPVSCGVCKGACKDTHDDCPGWAREGECVSNPGHTLKVCPNSCNMDVCNGPCEDKVSSASATAGVRRALPAPDSL